MASDSSSKLPYINETVLKHKKSLHQIEAQRKEKRATQKKKGGPYRLAFKRPEQIIKDFRSQERTDVRMKRATKKPLPEIDDGQKVGVVVRVRGAHGASPKAKALLMQLRLRQVDNAVFVKLTPAVLATLKLIEPFVAYGYPTMKTVHELVTKRGFGIVAKARAPLNDNKIIESALGEFNILCAEDIVHEIFTCGPHFKEVTRFLWPFKLNPSHGTHTKKPTQIKVGEGEKAGNHKEQINEMIKKMN